MFFFQVSKMAKPSVETECEDRDAARRGPAWRPPYRGRRRSHCRPPWKPEPRTPASSARFQASRADGQPCRADEQGPGPQEGRTGPPSRRTQRAKQVRLGRRRASCDWLCGGRGGRALTRARGPGCGTDAVGRRGRRPGRTLSAGLTWWGKGSWSPWVTGPPQADRSTASDTFAPPSSPNRCPQSWLPAILP